MWDQIPSHHWQLLQLRLHLSSRYFQVLKGLLLDETEGAVGLRLDISVHTVHTYVKRIYRRLGVHSRSEAVNHVLTELESIRRSETQSDAQA